MKRAIAFTVSAFSLLVGFAVVAQTTVATTTPTEVKYAPIPFAPGAEYAFLAGDGSRAENYTLRVHLKPGAKMPPHTHPDTRMITVLSGEVIFGTGAKFDPSNGTHLPAGSFFVMPAGTIHWSWADSGDVTYQESGTGPTATAPVNQ
jgi:quercetin dioxygenase-like cupin family protein